jgi:hypothetical protein
MAGETIVSVEQLMKCWKATPLIGCVDPGLVNAYGVHFGSRLNVSSTPFITLSREKEKHMVLGSLDADNRSRPFSLGDLSDSDE